MNDTKFLGVKIDNKLSWCPHCTYISKKIAWGIGIILKARTLFDNETLFSWYYTSLNPYINYYSHIWGEAYHTRLPHLVVLQNKGKWCSSTNKCGKLVCQAWYFVCTTPIFLRCWTIYVQIGKWSTPWCLWPLVNVLMSMSTIPDMHQCNLSVSAFEQTIAVKNLRYRGAHIWGYIVKNNNPKSAIG